MPSSTPAPAARKRRAPPSAGPKARAIPKPPAAPRTRPSLALPAPAYGFSPRRALRHLRACDPRMAELIARVGPFRLALRDHGGIFASLVHAITFQQLHAAAAQAIFERLRERVGGGRYPTPERILAASDRDLRAAGLSRQKILSLRDLAARTLTGVVPSLERARALGDAELIERLTAVRGVGEWTVHMLLIFALGRPDVLPSLDYGVRQGFAIAYRRRALPKPRELSRLGERWRPYRSVASWYLWQAVRLQREAGP